MFIKNDTYWYIVLSDLDERWIEEESEAKEECRKGKTREKCSAFYQTRYILLYYTTEALQTIDSCGPL